MGSPKKNSAPAAKVDLYDKLIATHPEIERKGAANPYTSLNGNMFTLLHDSSRLAIRLPEDARVEFLQRYKTTLFEAYGAVMKEYVSVPEALLKNTKELQKYLEMSYEYVKTLKPKPTKKKSRLAPSKPICRFSIRRRLKPELLRPSVPEYRPEISVCPSAFAGRVPDCRCLRERLPRGPFP